VRILHTSDWHLGRVTYNHSRAADHDAVLTEIIALAREHRPDLICHTGDLFDHARPSYSDMGKAITVLQELAAIAPVVVACGNHDSALLLGLFTQLLGANSRIHFITAPRPGHDGVLRFPGPDGTILRLAALPFVHANRFIDPFDDPATWQGNYADRVGRLAQALADDLLRDLDPGREVTVFAAHQYVAGAYLSGSERAAHSNDFYATRSEQIPTVDYAAFGHIHKPQALPGNAVTGRYAGSPIQLDFGEIGDRKSIVLVDLHPGRDAQIELVELRAGRRLRRLDGTLDEVRALAPLVGDELCLVTVHTATHEPTLSEQIRELLPAATVLQINEVCADRRLEILTEDAVAADLDPDFPQMFRDYLAEQGTKAAAVDRVMTTFELLFTSIDDEYPPTLPEEDLLAAPVPAGQTAYAGHTAHAREVTR